MCGEGNPQVAEEDRYKRSNEKEIQLPYCVVFMYCELELCVLFGSAMEL
jgi:hypothetical protein